MKKTKYNFDVLVIGGGPAGLAAALTLLNQSSLNVGIVESTSYTNMRIGESVSSSIIPLTRYLGIEKEFLSGDHIPSHGIDASWGTPKIRSRDFFFTGYGNGWNLDRSAFDRMMANAVLKRKGTLLLSTKLTKNKEKKNGWNLLALNEKGDKLQIHADFVIDASGKNASFARSMGVKWQQVDHLVGIVAMYKIKDDVEKSFTLIESTSNGWWYSTLIPGNRRILVFMTDSDIAKDIEIQKMNRWNLFLKKTLHIQKTVLGDRMLTAPKVLPAYSQVIKRTSFSNWAPAGDAVASFDPLSSMGIGHAITSGIQTARIAYDTLQSDGSLLSQYLDNVFDNFGKYLQNRRLFYNIEKRWKDNSFWKRRIYPNRTSAVAIE